ncbi:MAG TPA: MarR family transcriptional regulator [Chloroflexi bacterium]|nr:MarR family transcriptional regulator [Chloroflexota bacterium]
MGIFDRIQSEIETREKQEGFSPADLLALSPPLRRLMSYIIREGEVTAAAAAELVQVSPTNAQQLLDGLVHKGYLEREEREEGWVYRTRFARKRGREIPAGIWSALGRRTRPAPHDRDEGPSRDA